MINSCNLFDSFKHFINFNNFKLLFEFSRNKQKGRKMFKQNNNNDYFKTFFETKSDPNSVSNQHVAIRLGTCFYLFSSDKFFIRKILKL